MYKHIVYIFEYEREWGDRVDEIKEFPTKEEAQAFVREFNSKNNEPRVSDWYMDAEYMGMRRSR